MMSGEISIADGVKRADQELNESFKRLAAHQGNSACASQCQEEAATDNYWFIERVVRRFGIYYFHLEPGI